MYQRHLGFLILTAVAAVGTGAVVAQGPAGIAVASLGASVVWLLGVGRVLGRSAAIAALAGNLVLLYGFANLGIPAGGVSIPVTELLLAVAVVWGLAQSRGSAGARSVRWWFALLLLALLHLMVGLRAYGLIAVRDFLLPLEAGFLVVGYRLGWEGRERVVAWLRWVFLGCAIYFALYPAAELLAAWSPVVGIQRPVPLLGQYAGAGPVAIAGFFFMVLLRPFGRWSYVIAMAFLAELLLFQARGDYLAFAVATLVLVGLAGAGGRRARVRAAVGTALAIGAFAAAALLPFSPSGRLGQASPSFYAQHVGTLFAEEGPGAGTIRERLRWIQLTSERVAQEPYGLVTGVGYGPDLTGGFTVGSGIQVRKPHNDYLEMFGRLGVPGLVLFLGLCVSMVLPVLRSARRVGTSEARFLWWVVAAVASYLVVAAVQPVLAFPYGTVPLFTLGGIGLAVVDRARAVEDGG